MKKEKQVPLSIPAGGNGNTLDFEESSDARVTALERWLARTMYRMLGEPAISFVLWNGETLGAEPGFARTRLHIRDRKSLYRLFSNPNLHFGDLYAAGNIEVEGNFLSFLETAYLAMNHMERSAGPLRRWIMEFLTKAPRANTMAGSKKNIYHHYDISNEFYSLWLDNDYMQYTCAYYPSPDLTLEQAQAAKLEHICRKLQLKAGDTVVEAGCGWGGLARYMAKHYGVRVRSYNISHEQIAYARNRACAEGLDDRIEYIEDDYRNISGEYDVFVSVGMLEHVGHENFSELGKVIDRCLKSDGRGLIHTIGRNRPALMNAWIEKRIFPGAYPPALKEMMDIFQGENFSVLDVENLRLHYSRTLEHWAERYEEHAPQIEEMFDTNFVRAWRLYLIGSIAAFNTGELQLFQVAFSRFDNNRIPRTREQLYKKEDLTLWS